MLTASESYKGDRHRFDGEVLLARSRAVGYTVRAVPKNGLLTSEVELGLVAMARAEAQVAKLARAAMRAASSS